MKIFWWFIHSESFQTSTNTNLSFISQHFLNCLCFSTIEKLFNFQEVWFLSMVSWHNFISPRHKRLVTKRFFLSSIAADFGGKLCWFFFHSTLTNPNALCGLLLQCMRYTQALVQSFKQFSFDYITIINDFSTRIQIFRRKNLFSFGTFTPFSAKLKPSTAPLGI